jgi:hypothetical protein
MSSDSNSKFTVYDDRIIQNKPEYAVHKGGESIVNTPFRAISANTSQINFNVNVPSPNIFIDRAVSWTSTASLAFNVVINNAATAANIPTTTSAAGNYPVVTFGADCALCAFPMHQMTQTMISTINDVVVSMNTAELLPQLLRLTDYEKNLHQKTCPAMLDTYGKYDDGYGSNNSPLNSYYCSVPNSYSTNGSYNKIVFCDPNDSSPLSLTVPGSYTYGGVQVWYNNGVPHCGNANPATAINPAITAGTPLPVGITFTSTELLVLPPFIFSDSQEMSTGLFGINAFQVLMNLTSAVGLKRLIRSTTKNFRTISNVGFAGGPSPISKSVLNVIFITPNLSVPLPAISCVPWLETPRYTTAITSIPARTVVTVPSNNIVLPCIPDLFIIFAKPQVYGTNDADYVVPITNVTVNFNNFSGLMTTYSQEQLYHIAIQNGLQCDFNTFCGAGYIAKQGSLQSKIQLCGAPLIIKPGKDFALQTGLSSGVHGNFNLQYSVTLDNSANNSATGDLLLYTICVNSGFFESQGGSSRLIRAPLNEADVINAPVMSNPMGKQKLQRLIGGGIFDSLSNMVSKAHKVYESTKPYVQAVKGMLPDDSKVKSGLHAIGYGKKKSMSDRY